MVRALLLLVVACGGRAQPASPPTTPLTSTPETAEAAYEAKDWAECALQWSAISERLDGEQKAGALYDAASCYALDGRGDSAIAALEAAIAAGYWDAPHLADDPDLASARTHAKWPAVLARANARFAELEKSIREPALRRELLAMAEADQAARAGDEVGMREADRVHTERMREIVAKHGWPGKSIAGADGANAAWLIVQHADHDRSFQRACLEKMEALVEAGEVSRRDFAYLWDRVAINEGRPQRYGTQFDGDDVAPLEDPKNVDARRKAMGLSTLAEYRELVRKLEKSSKK